jgi:hypothetical protein
MQLACLYVLKDLFAETKVHGLSGFSPNAVAESRACHA